MSQKQTYCTNCKMNVDIADGKFVRLANNRVVFVILPVRLAKLLYQLLSQINDVPS